MKLYHISFRNDLPKKWIPRNVEGAIGPTGLHPEPDTPRICLSPSVKECFWAIYPNVSRFFEEENYPYMIFHIYSPENIDKKYLVNSETLTNKRWVWDAYMTNEHWYLKPINMKRVGSVKIFNTNKSKMISGRPFNDGNQKLIEMFPKDILIEVIKWPT